MALLSGDNPASMLAFLALIWSGIQEVRYWRYCKTCPFYLTAKAKADALSEEAKDV
jgi:hypothetical protein